MTKKYVSVKTYFKDNGDIKPLSIEFDDTTYEIDKVLDVVNAASLKVGGVGLRYKIMIGGNTTYLFFEKETGRWFVEAK